MVFLGQFAVGRPILAACLAVLISIVTAYGTSRLLFDDGMQTAFAGDTRAYRDFRQNEARFTPSQSDIAVLFRAPQPLDADDLEIIRDFALEASFATHVDSTLSVFSLRTSPDQNNRTMELFPSDLTALDDLSDRLAAARNHPLGGHRLLSEDFQRTLVIVSLAPEKSELGPARISLDEINASLTDIRNSTSLKAEATGLIPIRQTVIDAMLSDLVVLNGIGIVIGAILCLLAVRSPWLATLTCLPSMAALSWVIGAMGLFGLEINTLTNVVPVVVLVLALADSLHLTFEVRRQVKADVTPAAAIAEAMRRVAPACVLTSVTTAIAFAALCISDSELVRSLGWAGSMGTLISLLAVLLIHPLVFLAAMRVPRVQRLLQDGRETPWAVFSGRPFFTLAFRSPRLIATVSLITLVAALAAFSLAKPQYTFLENISKTNPARIALDEVDAHLTATATIDLPVTLPEGGLSNPVTLSLIETVADVAGATVPEAGVSSLMDLARWIDDPDDGSTLRRIQSIYDDMPSGQQRRFLSDDQSTTLVRLFLPDHGARETQKTLDALKTALVEAGLDSDQVQAPTGLLAMSSEISVGMIRHLNVSFTIAVGAAGLIIGLWYRNWRYGLIALVPNVFPIACVGAWLYFSGRGLQFSSAIALTIAFGIAVDDTIHVLNRMKLTAPPDSPFEADAIRKAFAEISPALVATTLVLGFGMLGTQFGSIPTISYFGALTIAVFVLALLSVLIVLPALMMTISGGVGSNRNMTLKDADL